MGGLQFALHLLEKRALRVDVLGDSGQGMTRTTPARRSLRDILHFLWQASLDSLE